MCDGYKEKVFKRGESLLCVGLSALDVMMREALFLFVFKRHFALNGIASAFRLRRIRMLIKDLALSNNP